MEKYFPVLRTCPLFAGIREEDLAALLLCLGATAKEYDKSDFIFRAGESVTGMGIVLQGSVHVVREDYWGNRVILARCEAGELFGEAFSCMETERLPVSVAAAEAAAVLFIDSRKIVAVCSSTCVFHIGLVKNMLRVLAEKNVMLTRKMEFITQRSTREKLLCYLSAQAQRAGSPVFDIPFGRQELADYLSVDRSAMSNELSKLRSDGLVRFHRKHFELLQPEVLP